MRRVAVRVVALWLVGFLAPMLGGSALAQGSRVKLLIAFPASLKLEDVPALLAGERLRAQGVELNPVAFVQENLAIQAVNRGDADVGKGLPGTLIAMQQGAKLKLFVSESRNRWTLVAKKDVTRCEDLNGRRLAYHDYVAVGTALVQSWIKEHCPSVKPNVLILPGSENRAAALVAGQIDVTPLELPDVLQLERVRPGQFHLLADFGHDAPWLLGAVFFTTPHTLTGKRDALKAFVRELLKIHRLIQADPGVIAAVAPKYIKGQDPALIPEITKTFVERNIWPLDGGFTPEIIDRTVQFYVSAGNLKPGLRGDQIGEYSLVREVLKEIGK